MTVPIIVELTTNVEVPVFPPEELLISEDGVPLESDWHAIEIDLLRELVHQHFASRTDFFAGGNMFIYFNEEQARNKDYRGPDFFLVWGASPMPLRPYWAIWKEGGKYPDLIIELLSPSTAVVDRTVKKNLYEQTFRTPDYFCYDPISENLEGWHLNSDGEYEPLVANKDGWLWSKELQLWLGLWSGLHLGRLTTWLRFFTSVGKLVPTGKEVADAAKERADAAEDRANAAEAELARLKPALQPKKN